MRFHSIIWPAMLMSMGMPLPKHVYGHGWLVIDGGKCPSPRATSSIPRPVRDVRRGRPAVLPAADVPFGSDGNFSNELLIGTINTDLANKLGNLVSRTTGMAEKYFGGKLPVQREDTPEDCELKKMACALRDRYQAGDGQAAAAERTDEVFKVIDRVTSISTRRPPGRWAGREQARAPGRRAVQPAGTIRICTTLLLPVMPDTCDKIFAKLGADEACRSWDNANVWGVLPTRRSSARVRTCFPVSMWTRPWLLNELQESRRRPPCRPWSWSPMWRTR